MTDERVLICGVNWLGDSVMTLPAVRAWKKLHPDASLHVLVKANLAAFWRLQPDVDSVMVLETGGGTWRTARRIREQRFSSAYILPNSFRSALVPFMARVPVRRGVAGHGRTWMLTDAVEGHLPPERVHQAWEYVRILGLDDQVQELPAPVLRTGKAETTTVSERFGLGAATPYGVLIPGAARGPSKQWPPEHFASVGRALGERHGLRVVVSGTDGEKTLCARVANDVGGDAFSVAGETSLTELTALLAAARLAVTNDSGGMHLAAAAGCPVVAVFGLTDATKTGPIGDSHRVVTRDDVRHSRDIPRNSQEAVACLRSIGPDRVMATIEEVLAES